MRTSLSSTLYFFLCYTHAQPCSFQYKLPLAYHASASKGGACISTNSVLYYWTTISGPNLVMGTLAWKATNDFKKGGNNIWCHNLKHGERVKTGVPWQTPILTCRLHRRWPWGTTILLVVVLSMGENANASDLLMGIKREVNKGSKSYKVRNV